MAGVAKEALGQLNPGPGGHLASNVGQQFALAVVGAAALTSFGLISGPIGLSELFTGLAGAAKSGLATFIPALA